MILGKVGADKPEAVMATVITSYALSSILTGVIFLLLSVLRLGDLVSFFPRSILLGCIGGVGVFLFLTGIEVSAGLDSNMEWNLDVFERLIAPNTLVLWIIPLALSILLMVIRHYLSHPVVMPAFFICVVGIFYIIFAALPKVSLADLQRNGWVFAAPEAGVPFYNFYTYYSKRPSHDVSTESEALTGEQTSSWWIGKPSERLFQPCSRYHSSALFTSRLTSRLSVSRSSRTM